LFLTAVPQLDADQREACNTSGEYGFDFAFSRFPLSLQIFGTAHSSQGRALYARRKKIFSAFEKIFWSVPLTARTVPEHRIEGKAGGRSQEGIPHGGVWGSAPAPYRARSWRAAARIGTLLLFDFALFPSSAPPLLKAGK
jgi:hypothetical protein